MATKISRRDVLKASAAAAIGAAVAPAVASTRTRLPGQKLAVGIIGCGGKGTSGTEAAAQYGDIVALCDVDANERSKALLKYPRAATFDDYRVMLEALRGKIDAVIISTPDHHHATASAMAMRMGMHCYCEKPLTRTIWEARQLAKIAKEKKVATQMGNQSTASTPMRKIASLIRSGKFGAVKEVYLWTDRAAGWWPQGVPRPKPTAPPPTLDFDLWVGPRPMRPYSPDYTPFKWRGWWDFGTGALGDMGCHIFNMSHMALQHSNPLSVRAETSGTNHDSFPAWSIVHYEFGPQGKQPGYSLHWYDGGKKPDPSLAKGFEFGGNGSIVVCENATIYSPNEGNTEFFLVGGSPMPTIEIEESPGHMAEFFRAAEGGKPAVSNFPDYASPLTEVVLLGNLAIWAGGAKVDWDAKKMQVKGSNEYDSLIKPTFRPGWSV